MEDELVLVLGVGEDFGVANLEGEHWPGQVGGWPEGRRGLGERG